jgi:hypothetical protein
MKAIKNPFVNKIISWDVVSMCNLTPLPQPSCTREEKIYIDKRK